MTPTLVVAGTNSGVGKTTVAVGLMQMLRSLGLRVQPCKVGPDFLDPLQHERVCGVPSVNLDGWLMGRERCLAAFDNAVLENKADIAVVEGCMGLHDGRSGSSDDGSTAQVAKWLGSPVILVVDAWSLARSAAAMVHGYRTFDTEVNVAATVFNKVGGDSHGAWLCEAIEHCETTKDVKVLACLPSRKSIKIEERLLGLLPPSSSSLKDEGARLASLQDLFEEHFDLEAVRSLASRAYRAPPTSTPISQIPSPVSAALPPIVIAVARDDAFCFFYHENFAALRRAGATIEFFSPLNDALLPVDAAMLYIGGGYPELHAEALSKNTSMLGAVRAFSERGGFIWAECGGLMYLAQQLITRDRRSYDMCGVLSFDVTMTTRCAMGYCSASLTPQIAALLRLEASKARRCQQYHFSEPTLPGSGEPAVLVDAQGNGGGIRNVNPALNVEFEALVSNTKRAAPEGAHVGKATVATYCHFPLDDELANAFVGVARRATTIVSLVPSASEAATAILGDGFKTRVIGRSAYCDFPPNVSRLPVVSQSSLDLGEDMTGAEVEAKMREAKLKSRPSNNKPHVANIDFLRTHRPGFVVCQDSCPACGILEGTTHAALEAAGLDAGRALTLKPMTVAGALDSIMLLGQALGEAENARRCVDDLEQRLEAVASRVSSTNRPRVLGLESCAPLVASGQWLPDMRIRAGGVDALGDEPGAPARIVTIQEIAASQADIVIICCCGRTARGAAAEVDEHLLKVQSLFWDLPALKGKNSHPKIFVVDHNKFSRPGPRVVDGVETVAALLQIDDFSENLMRPELVGVLRLIVESNEAPRAWRWEPVISDDAGIALALDPDPLPLVTSSPRARCASVMVPMGDGGLVIFGGEDARGERLGDVWSLAAPIGEDCDASWEGWTCGKIHGEDVPTARSNHAAACCGDYLLVFGGWGDKGTNRELCAAPLASAELLHLKTRCWTHCSTTNENCTECEGPTCSRCSSEGPAPRGNPTLVYAPRLNAAILYGGWDGIDRLGDAWILSLDTWTWRELGGNGTGAVPVPAARTDHTAAIWRVDDIEELLVVFGGSTTAGASNDVWTLNSSSGDWAQIVVEDGPQPHPRTSHASAVAGQGADAVLVVVGGQDSSRGSGAVAILDDAWVLPLGPGKREWRRIEGWRGRYPMLRCRHTLNIVSDSNDLALAVVFGGWDGESVLDDHRSCFFASIDSTRHAVADREAAEEAWVRDLWTAQIPLTLSDLDAATLERARRSTLPLALAKALHRAACQEKPPRDTYVDPDTGYSVFTAACLKRRPCCGNGCRHCPWGHKNVKVQGEKRVESEKVDMEW
ncbi:hypothetical protein TrST_g12054 [Triparma strigata]|uniref:Cobyrinic acid a,c-diamide synthase n=1 Tax=Triparma strigata TaxID=1606541 RepID=A0A9W7A192_9STRA|nr:hypothetical protein TrST_g12054 [Triparma strigata]